MTTPDLGLDTLPPQAPRTLDDDERRRRRKMLLLLLLGLILLVLVLFSIWYLLSRKPVTDIIPPTDNFAMPTFVNAAYDIEQPLGIAVSPDGSRIYVTQDKGSHEALILDGQGMKLGTLAPPAQGGAGTTQMFVAVDPGTGDVYTTDRTAGQVRIYTADGTFKSVLEPPAEMGAWQPLGITVDAKGNVFVADVAPPFTRVHEFTRERKFVRDFGTAGQLNHPNGLALDSNGNLYVSNTGDGQLLIFDQTGERLASVSHGPGVGNVGLPRGIAIDDRDRVYVVDSTGQQVLVYLALKDGASSLEYVDQFGKAGAGDGAFAFPNGVAVDARSRVYIADWNNDRVEFWSY